MNKELARELIGAGVHFGHAASRWNPKMKPYIFGKRGMIHIINVKETLKGLMIAKKLLTTVVSGGRDVVFVGTKRQAKKAVQGASQKCGMVRINRTLHASRFVNDLFVFWRDVLVTSSFSGSDKQSPPAGFSESSRNSCLFRIWKI